MAEGLGVDEPNIVVGEEDQESEDDVAECVDDIQLDIGVDLSKIAHDYAQYLVVDSKRDKQLLDEKVESVGCRMEEMKNQLDWMKQSMSSNTQKTELLLENTKRLKELFQRVDQIEAFVNLVSKNLDAVEESVTSAEKALDPSTLQKVFQVLPGLRKTSRTTNPPSNWRRPETFSTSEYFQPTSFSNPDTDSVQQ